MNLGKTERSKRVAGLRCIAIAVLCGVATGGSAAPPKLPVVAPARVGLDVKKLSRINEVVAEGLADQKMPGCVVAVGYRGKIVWLKAYGHRQLVPEKLPMTTDTVFDMASLTKPIATATSVMILAEQGKLRIGERVSRYIPAFAANEKAPITLRQLLIHQGGLIPDNAIADYQDGREQAMKRIYDLKLYRPVGEKFVYTDVGFILLADLVARRSGLPIDRFSANHIFGPLGMKETGFNPPPALRRRAAPTEKREGKWIQGQVHDPRAHLLQGVAGHAGLFSTAEDLAVYAQTMLNGGSYQGVRILSERAVDVMTRSYAVSSGTRGLGWDKRTGFSSNRGELMTSRAFGHGGFTGTAMWMDPGLDLFVIFLSNRVHPDAKDRRRRVNRLAGRIGSIAAAAVSSPRRPVSRIASRSIETGIDVLERRKFSALDGLKIGLITNQTGINRRGVSTARLMQDAANVKLVALFSPEHGLEGKLDISKIADSKDAKTGLKVYSLYGKTRRPSAESLAGLDALVFDIQDIGTRYYTYISTMGNAMEAAAASKRPFIVLDRPNPINGTTVDGPVRDEDKPSFIAYHTLPVRHGMTAGELARMFKKERSLDLDLRVVRMKGWRRDSYLDDYDLFWVNPSPNMRNMNQALLYPGIGLLETTNLSVGRGTDTPFEIFGAPWLDGRKLAGLLNRSGLGGVRFSPVFFQPTASVYKGQRCQGVRITIVDRKRLDATRLGFEVAFLLRTHFKEWRSDRYHRLLANDRVFSAVKAGKSASQIERVFGQRLEQFRRRRAEFLLYR